jgi:hypothetical protein
MSEKQTEGRTDYADKGHPTAIIWLAVVVLLAAFLFGLWLASRPSDAYIAQREAQKLQSAAHLTQVKDWFFTGAAVCFLVAMAGAVGLGLHWLWTQTHLVRARHGLFPLIKGRVGGATFYHDPNRQVAGAVAYLPDAEHGVRARHMSGASESAQVQVTGQAQATQLIAAAVGEGEGGLDAQRQEVVAQVAEQVSRNPARMPELIALDASVPDDRLLLRAVEADWQEVKHDD